LANNRSFVPRGSPYFFVGGVRFGTSRRSRSMRQSKSRGALERGGVAQTIKIVVGSVRD
jgi:hypothetical protein